MLGKYSTNSAAFLATGVSASLGYPLHDCDVASQWSSYTPLSQAFCSPTLLCAGGGGLPGSGDANSARLVISQGCYFLGVVGIDIGGAT